MSASVAIVIVNWNSYEVTRQCLDSLRTITYKNFEAVLVDNGSDDGSGEKLKAEYPEVTLLTNSTNLGFTGGNNRGIQYALDKAHDYIMLLNNDAIATADFLGNLVTTLESDSTISAIQPKIMYDYDRTVIWNAGGRFQAFFSLMKTIGEAEKDTGQCDQPGPTQWITGCCFMIRASVVRQIGLLDDKFFIYYEDADWSLKLRKSGRKMWYEPRAKIFHIAGMSDVNRDKHGEGNVSPFSIYQGVRNHLFIVRRYARGINLLGSWGFQIAKVTGYLIYFAFRGRFVKLRAVLRGAYHGLIQ